MSRLEYTLPSGIRDHLPGDAESIHQLRGQILAEMRGWGYRRVMTPMFEYSDVIRVGMGDNNQQLFQMVDPQSGHILALRPDITPQVARVVATRMADESGPLRLCYYGHVYRLDTHGGYPRREILQAGAELIGLASPEADAEVIALGISCLESRGITGYSLDIGDVEIGRSYVEELQLDAEQKRQLHGLFETKNRSDLKLFFAEIRRSGEKVETLLELLDLYGDRSVLAEARRLLTHPVAVARLRYLEQVLAILDSLGIGDRVLLDLGEVRGWEYYTGLLFSVLVPGLGIPILTGGRYDNLLEGYGPSRPATGFAVDLEQILDAIDAHGEPMSASGTTFQLVDQGAGVALLNRVAGVIRARGAIALNDLGAKLETPEADILVSVTPAGELTLSDRRGRVERTGFDGLAALVDAFGRSRSI